MSRKLSPEEIDQLAAFISAERLSKLITLTGNSGVAIKFHQEMLGLNSCLIKIVATIEIALRNTIYNTISDHFGVANWLQQTPIKLKLVDGDRTKIVAALDSARRSEYAKMSQAEKAALKAAAFPNGTPKDTGSGKFARKNRENIPVSEGKVIAELTFAFWKRLYSPEYDQQLWRTTLKRTFPNKSLQRSQVAAQLEVVYQMRNRLAHHEPVFGNRFRKLIEAIQFVASELGNRRRIKPPALKALIASDIENVVRTHSRLEAELALYSPTTT